MLLNSILALLSLKLFLSFPVNIKRSSSGTEAHYYPNKYSQNYNQGVFSTHKHLISQNIQNETLMQQIGLDFLSLKLSVPVNEFEINHAFKDHYGIMHIYASRLRNGIQIYNQRAQVHFKHGRVVSFSASFKANEYDPKPISKSQPRVSLTMKTAIMIAEEKLGIPHLKDIQVKRVFIENSQKEVIETYSIQLKGNGQWFEVFVDVHDGRIIHAVNFASKARYNIIPLKNSNPIDGGFSTVTNPAFIKSSPLGWHSDNQTAYKILKGNNVETIRYDEMYMTKYQVNGGSDLSFTEKYNIKDDANTTANANVSATNLFYLVNMMHDFSYQYGFTEVAGNFQFDNFGKGGKGDDHVIASVQDPNQRNNAAFFSPPDGQSGELKMFLFDYTSPMRDGALDNSIPIHEYTHGISSRLTGGANDPSCLGLTESMGMGEGWSDAMAFYIQRKSTDTRKLDIVMGAWSSNRPSGIRSFPYSVNMAINPLRYSDLNQRTEAHGVGEIWATFLYEMYWNLVDDFGFSDDIFNSSQLSGNIVGIQLLIGGMMIQPCNPSFKDARDAIIQADYNYYDGMHYCSLYKAFAKRGLGLNATSEYIDDFVLPTTCGNPITPTETIELDFKDDFTVVQSGKLRKGLSVRILYDIYRIGVPCYDIDICAFMNKNKPLCRRVAYRPGKLQTSFTLTETGTFSIYIHSYSPNPYHLPGVCDKYDSNLGANWRFNVES